ncbi:MAG TPA: hypothetical protein VJI96_05320 [Candidatus Andersenbacteria bacterium]|nr:hypothetical protein [Candidatus Andersenbacteria bacterium]
MQLPVLGLQFWMEIEIGGSAKEALIASSQGVLFIGSIAKDVIMQDSCIVLSEKRNLKLARCKVRDLSLSGSPTLEQIQDRLRDIGYSSCDPEVPLRVHLRMNTQKNKGTFWYIMKPIADSKGELRIFRENLSHDGCTWCLHALPINLLGQDPPDRRFERDDEIVFGVPNA